MKIGDIKYIVDINNHRPYIYKVKIIEKYDSGNYRAEFIEEILNLSYEDYDLVGANNTFEEEDLFDTVSGVVKHLTTSWGWGMKEHEIIRNIFIFNRNM